MTIHYWVSKRGAKIVRAVRIALCLCLVFTLAVPPFAQASVWEERQEEIQKRRGKREKLEAAVNFSAARPVAEGAGHAAFGLEIPEVLGSVVESWEGADLGAKPPSGQEQGTLPLVIHIQDAHGVYEAQKNAAAILKSLHSKKSASNAQRPEKSLMVCVEGAWNRVIPDWLSVFPDEGVKKEFAESLLRQGEVTGEEYLSILEPPGTLLIYGVEDPKVYGANLKCRSLLDRERERIVRGNAALQARLERLKKRLYSQKLLELDNASRQFHNRKVGIREYLRYLRNASVAPGSDGGRYPHLKILAELSELEARISLPDVEEERKNLLDRLGELLDQATLIQLAQASLNYRMGEASSRKYHESLVRLADLHHVSVPYIGAYVAYLKKHGELNAAAAGAELAQYENEIFQGWAGRDPAAGRLIAWNRLLVLEGNFWREEFSPEDWQDYLRGSEGNKGGFRRQLRELAEGLAEQEALQGLAPIGGQSPGKLYLAEEQTRFLQESYYQLAFKRDSLMVEKTLERARAEGRDRVVLIAGGFHSPGMTRILRQKGASYVVIRPRLKLASGASEKPRKRPNPIHFTSVMNGYMANLESLRREAARGGEIGREWLGHLTQAIDVFKNRLFFAGPMTREGRTYVAGAYQGDRARVNFMLEFSGRLAEQQVASTEFREALKAAMGSLRNPTHHQTGQPVDAFACVSLLAETLAVSGEEGLQAVRFNDAEIVQAYDGKAFVPLDGPPESLREQISSVWKNFVLRAFVEGKDVIFRMRPKPVPIIRTAPAALTLQDSRDYGRSKGYTERQTQLRVAPWFEVPDFYNFQYYEQHVWENPDASWRTKLSWRLGILAMWIAQFGGYFTFHHLVPNDWVKLVLSAAWALSLLMGAWIGSDKLYGKQPSLAVRWVAYVLNWPSILAHFVNNLLFPPLTLGDPSGPGNLFGELKGRSVHFWMADLLGELFLIEGVVQEVRSLSRSRTAPIWGFKIKTDKGEFRELAVGWREVPRVFQGTWVKGIFRSRIYVDEEPPEQLEFEWVDESKTSAFRSRLDKYRNNRPWMRNAIQKVIKAIIAQDQSWLGVPVVKLDLQDKDIVKYLELLRDDRKAELELWRFVLKHPESLPGGDAGQWIEEMKKIYEGQPLALGFCYFIRNLSNRPGFLINEEQGALIKNATLELESIIQNFKPSKKLEKEGRVDLEKKLERLFQAHFKKSNPPSEPPVFPLALPPSNRGDTPLLPDSRNRETADFLQWFSSLGPRKTHWVKKLIKIAVWFDSHTDRAFAAFSSLEGGEIDRYLSLTKDDQASENLMRKFLQLYGVKVMGGAPMEGKIDQTIQDAKEVLREQGYPLIRGLNDLILQTFFKAASGPGEVSWKGDFSTDDGILTREEIKDLLFTEGDEDNIDPAFEAVNLMLKDLRSGKKPANFASAAGEFLTWVKSSPLKNEMEDVIRIAARFDSPDLPNDFEVEGHLSPRQTLIYLGLVRDNARSERAIRHLTAAMQESGSPDALTNEELSLELEDFRGQEKGKPLVWLLHSLIEKRINPAPDKLQSLRGAIKKLNVKADELHKKLNSQGGQSLGLMSWLPTAWLYRKAVEADFMSNVRSVLEKTFDRESAPVVDSDLGPLRFVKTPMWRGNAAAALAGFLEEFGLRFGLQHYLPLLSGLFGDLPWMLPAVSATLYAALFATVFHPKVFKGTASHPVQASREDRAALLHLGAALSLLSLVGYAINLPPQWNFIALGLLHAAYNVTARRQGWVLGMMGTGRLRWRNRKEVIANVRSALNSEKPDILKRYDQLRRGKLEEDQIKALRNDIYKITQGYFIAWGLGKTLDREGVPYFKGSYVNVLLELFPDPRLGLNPLGFQLDWSSRKRALGSPRIELGT